MDKFYHAIVCVLLLALHTSHGAECDNGWRLYKDELCVKAFTEDLLTFNQAISFCSSQGKTSTLLMIKDSELQEILTFHTHSIFDNFWLGGRFDGSSSGEFKWVDGTPLTYANWATGHPKTTTGTEGCISVKPPHTRRAVDAKWENSACERRNPVICQKLAFWTKIDAVSEIIEIRKEQNTLKQELNSLKQQIARQVPLGFIYIEYNGQTNPATLWPNFVWRDITSTYAGLFFRAMGAGSEDWGTTQSACAPRITKSEGYWKQSYEDPVTIPANGWSGWGMSGIYYPTGTSSKNNIRFYTAGCEVRPRNQAVRIWKRIN